LFGDHASRERRFGPIADVSSGTAFPGALGQEMQVDAAGNVWAIFCTPAGQLRADVASSMVTREA